MRRSAAARDTTFTFLSRAPQADIERWKTRMGWDIPWFTVTDDFEIEIGRLDPFLPHGAQGALLASSLAFLAFGGFKTAPALLLPLAFLACAALLVASGAHGAIGGFAWLALGALGYASPRDEAGLPRVLAGPRPFSERWCPGRAPASRRCRCPRSRAWTRWPR